MPHYYSKSYCQSRLSNNPFITMNEFLKLAINELTQNCGITNDVLLLQNMVVVFLINQMCKLHLTTNGMKSNSTLVLHYGLRHDKHIEPYFLRSMHP